MEFPDTLEQVLEDCDLHAKSSPPGVSVKSHWGLAIPSPVVSCTGNVSAETVELSHPDRWAHGLKYFLMA